ncbi:MAG: hypothetical protein ACRDEA_20445, partial [Microcystaceae cyanobacterium]
LEAGKSGNPRQHNLLVSFPAPLVASPPRLIEKVPFIPRVSVERAAHRQGQRWTTGDPLHPNL